MEVGSRVMGVEVGIHVREGGSWGGEEEVVVVVEGEIVVAADMVGVWD